MAEEMDPEKKLQEDVMKAAENAMKMEQEAAKAAEQDAQNESAPADKANEENPAESTTENAGDQAQKASAEQVPSIEDSLRAELSQANDRNLRLMAEFENFRRRSAKEQLDIIEVANGKLLEKLSEVLDNFERAFAAENKGDLQTFEKGMQMIHNQFAKVLSDAGLEQIDPVGQEFDPNCHEALMQQPSETIPEGHVVTVFMKGYKLKNKILKPAKVIVSSGK